MATAYATAGVRIETLATGTRFRFGASGREYEYRGNRWYGSPGGCDGGPWVADAGALVYVATGRGACPSCAMLSINGVACHETGCPEAWKRVRECRECGWRFVPEVRGQTCCDDQCHAAYHGLPVPEGDGDE